jgi:hypothetical protein
MLNTASYVCTAFTSKNLLTQADLMSPPGNGLNSIQLSVKVGMTSTEAYGRGYVTIGKFAGW